MKNFLYIKQITSTNEMLWKMIREKSVPEGFILYTDFQKAGKGQIGNTWESKARKNLLFSMVMYPKHIPIDEQFVISQFVSLAIKKTLDNYIDDVCVKWPNDIYWNDKKLGGILIENSLQGKEIKATVVGIGLNINQKNFESDAPNPVSIFQILGKTVRRKKILIEIQQNILEMYNQLDFEKIRLEYFSSLYRKDGYHTYKAEDEMFRAKIKSVHPDGQLELQTESGECRGFYFKEVQFLTHSTDKGK